MTNGNLVEQQKGRAVSAKRISKRFNARGRKHITSLTVFLYVAWQSINDALLY